MENHIGKDLSEDELQPREDEEEQPGGPRDSQEMEEEGEQPSRQGQEQSKEAVGKRMEQEDDREDAPAEEDPTEAERSLDLAAEDVGAEEMQGEDSTYLRDRPDTYLGLAETAPKFRQVLTGVTEMPL